MEVRVLDICDSIIDSRLFAQKYKYIEVLSNKKKMKMFFFFFYISKLRLQCFMWQGKRIQAYVKTNWRNANVEISWILKYWRTLVITGEPHILTNSVSYSILIWSRVFTKQDYTPCPVRCFDLLLYVFYRLLNLCFAFNGLCDSEIKFKLLLNRSWSSRDIMNFEVLENNWELQTLTQSVFYLIPISSCVIRSQMYLASVFAHLQRLKVKLLSMMSSLVCYFP